MWKDEIRKEEGYRTNPSYITRNRYGYGTARIEFTDKDRLKMKQRELEGKVQTLRRIKKDLGEKIGILGSFEFSKGFPKDSADDISEVVKHLEAAFEILQDFGE